jgi:hypothetical protein
MELSSPIDSEPVRRRRLKDSSYCFCDKKTIAERAPTLEELEEALEAAITREGLDNVCGLVREGIKKITRQK